MFELVDKENLTKDWSSAMEKIKYKNSPGNDKILGFRFVYKMKRETLERDGKTKIFHRLESSLCVNGNKDNEKE